MKHFLSSESVIYRNHCLTSWFNFITLAWHSRNQTKGLNSKRDSASYKEQLLCNSHKLNFQTLQHHFKCILTDYQTGGQNSKNSSQLLEKKPHTVKEEHYSFLYCNMPRNLASSSRVSLDIYLAKYIQKPLFVGMLCCGLINSTTEIFISFLKLLKNDIFIRKF